MAGTLKIKSDERNITQTLSIFPLRIKKKNKRHNILRINWHRNERK